MSFTLEVCVVNQKCRKNKAAGTTKDGAFWLACKPIHLRDAGGDGIGQGGADIDYDLHLRHYRDGTIKAVVCRSSWHQNSGSRNSYRTVDILGLRTVEQVIVALKCGLTFDYGYGETETVYSDHSADTLTAALVALGMDESEPAPDEL
jgi:hypothetical protein